MLLWLTSIMWRIQGKKLGLPLSMCSNEYAKKIDQSKGNPVLPVGLHGKVKAIKIPSWGEKQKSLVKTEESRKQEEDHSRHCRHCEVQRT